jgi:hypothetical protein
MQDKDKQLIWEAYNIRESADEITSKYSSEVIQLVNTGLDEPYNAERPRRNLESVAEHMIINPIIDVFDRAIDENKAEIEMGNILFGLAEFGDPVELDEENYNKLEQLLNRYYGEYKEQVAGALDDDF